MSLAALLKANTDTVPDQTVVAQDAPSLLGAKRAVATQPHKDGELAKIDERSTYRYTRAALSSEKPDPTVPIVNDPAHARSLQWANTPPIMQNGRVLGVR
ncbi:MAG: hypothetical protein ACRECQ_00590, partial [Burkholderiaceae bacterium]